MQHCELTCFGVGDGWPCADRNHACFLYRLGEVSLLVDCGEPICRSFKNSGLPYDTVDRLLLSHLNFDHLAGLFMLLQGFWLEGRRKSLPIHLPEEGIGPVRELLRAGYLFDEVLPYRVSFEALKPQAPISTGPVRAVPYLNTHLDGFRQAFGAKYSQACEAFSFLIESGPLRIAHTADVGGVKDLEPLLQEPLDLLVCELAHFHPEELFARLRASRVRLVAFVHLARPIWENLASFRQQAQAALPQIRCLFPADGDRIEL